MTLNARLRRLEDWLVPPDPAITIAGWCDPEGRPCDPPGEVRHAVAEQAPGAWSCAVWAAEQGCAVLFDEGDELQVVEL